ncbi:hypothetical protein AAMO2058_000124600 [Amorphochlora amoebiformis]
MMASEEVALLPRKYSPRSRVSAVALALAAVAAVAIGTVAVSYGPTVLGAGLAMRGVTSRMGVNTNVGITRDVAVNSRQRKWEIREHSREPIKMGMMGTKAGMTMYYDDAGICHPVTVIALEEGNYVTQVKSKETDGYEAIQVAYKECRDRTIPWPERQHLRKHGQVKAMKHLREFKPSDISGYEPGQQLKAEELFSVGDLVDVSGTSVGKGFQGSVKRWNMARGPMTHGSKSHRQHGSIGCSATPSRVYKGLKMAGNMGNERRTIKKLPVMLVNDEDKYIVVRGSVPGKRGSLVEIRPTKLVGVHV